jgi:hypothetical protein
MNKKIVSIETMVKTLVVFIVLGLASACLSTNNTIMPNVDFSKYSFAIVEYADTSQTVENSAKMVAEMEMQKALMSNGYTIIRDTSALSTEDRSRVLSITVGITAQRGAYGYVDAGACTINIKDHTSGIILANFHCNVEWGGFKKLKDAPINAIRDMVKEIKK